MPKKVLILGGSGLVGSSLVTQFKDKYTVLSPTHNELDVTNRDNVRSFINVSKPDAIINSSGLARMEECENEPDLAYLLNARANDIVLSSLGRKKIPYYYISTDAVFDGIKSETPFTEDLMPQPVSVYSQSKAAGEKIVLQDVNNGVIRITLPYSTSFLKRSDRVRDVIFSLQNGDTYDGIIDQTINPLYVEDVAKGIFEIVESRASGIYHVAARDNMTNYDFLFLVVKLFKLHRTKLKKIHLSTFLKNKKAYRAGYCVLGVRKFEKDFYRLPTMEESLANFSKQFAFS